MRRARLRAKDSLPNKETWDPRLRWYPRSWRTRYGEELIALLDDEYEGRLPTLVQIGLLTGGLRQRARQSGLTGDSAPAAQGVRAGALVVLAAWVAFAIAGASFAKFSEHFDEALPRNLSAHRLADLAFTVLQTAAGVASVLVVAGALLALPAFVRYLRAGGWPSVCGHFLRALACTPTQWRPPLVRSTVLDLGNTHSDDPDVVDRGRDRGRQSRCVLQSDPDRRGNPDDCHRWGDGRHGRCHGGLVGCDGEGRTCLLESQPRRRPRFFMGRLARCHGGSDGPCDGCRRSWRRSRSAGLAKNAAGLNEAGSCRSVPPSRRTRHP
jgi:hypothetical protein